MSDNTPDRAVNTNGPSSEGGTDDQVLGDVKRQIDRIVEELSTIRASQNKVRNKTNREVRRLSRAESESDQEQISSGLRQLYQEEIAYGARIHDLEKTLSDLWSRRRILEGTPMPSRTPSADEAEEQRLRWLLLDIKRKQFEAAEECSASEDPAERSLQEVRFDELREQYNSVYNRLTEIREARDKKR